MVRTILSYCLILSWLVCPAIWAQQDNKILIVKILPERVTLNVSESLKFSAMGYNRYDQEISFNADWSCTSGTISQDGSYVAGSNPGVHTIMATDPKTGAQGSATVILKYNDSDMVTSDTNKIIRLDIFPAKVTLSPGDKVRFTMEGYNARGEKVRLPARLIWHVTGGSIAPDGTYQAGGAPGSYLVQIKEPNGVVTSAEVTIKGTFGRIANIKITPAEVILKPRATQRFFATGYDSSGNVTTFAPTWEASGGSIDDNGIYQAGPQAGTYFVKAKSGDGTSCTASVKIQSLNIANVEVTPKGALLAPGQLQKFEVRAYNSKGQLVAVAPSWSATGGMVQADGTYQAGKTAGNYILSISIENMNIEVPIVIRADVPARLIISPTNVALKPGDTTQFQVTVYTDQGQVIEVPLKWVARGGTIESNGAFLAGSVPGKYVLEVATVDGSMVAQAMVNIATSGTVTTVPQPTATAEWLTIKPTIVKLLPGDKVKFEVKAFDASGLEVPITISWQADGGKMEGNFYVAGPQEGKYLVIASVASGAKASSTVLIAPAPQVGKEKATQIKVAPAELRIKSGEQAKLEATLLDKDGNRAEGQLKWAATGGTIDATGNYRAGEIAGSFTITVTELGSDLHQDIKVEIAEAAPVEAKDPILIQTWQVGQGGKLIGQIFLKGRADHERSYLLQLVLFQKDGSQRVSTQIRVQPGNFFEFEGEYVRETTSAVGLVLFDNKFNPIYTYQKPTN